MAEIITVPVGQVRVGDSCYNKHVQNGWDEIVFVDECFGTHRITLHFRVGGKKTYEPEDSVCVRRADKPAVKGADKRCIDDMVCLQHEYDRWKADPSRGTSGDQVREAMRRQLTLANHAADALAYLFRNVRANAWCGADDYATALLKEHNAAAVQRGFAPMEFFQEDGRSFVRIKTDR